MAGTSKNSFPLRGPGFSNKRPTRRGLFGAHTFDRPWPVKMRVVTRKGISHRSAVFEVAQDALVSAELWCCRYDIVDEMAYTDGPTEANCLACALCRGCPACREGHIDEATMRLGKWESKDRRELYPFEMDTTHLINAIKKLRRDDGDFKPENWREWIDVLEVEKARRGI